MFAECEQSKPNLKRRGDATMKREMESLSRSERCMQERARDINGEETTLAVEKA